MEYDNDFPVDTTYTLQVCYGSPGERPVEVWAFDEHRLGLKPLQRRVWAKTGERPLARSSHKYKWLYLYAFVRPQSGAVEWWLASSVSGR